LKMAALQRRGSKLLLLLTVALALLAGRVTLADNVATQISKPIGVTVPNEETVQPGGPSAGHTVRIEFCTS